MEYAKLATRLRNEFEQRATETKATLHIDDSKSEEEKEFIVP